MEKLKITFLIATLFLLPQLFSCSPANSIGASRSSEKNESMQININELENFARIRLPKSYRDLKFHEETGIDRMMAFRFTMDEADLKEFIASAKYTGKLNSQELDRQLLTSDLNEYSWWKPDDAKKFLSGSYLEENKWTSKILIDLTNSPKVIVYVQVFTM